MSHYRAGGPPRGEGRRSPEGADVIDSLRKKIEEKGSLKEAFPSAEEIDRWGEKLGEILKPIKAHQMRRIHTSLKRVRRYRQLSQQKETKEEEDIRSKEIREELWSLRHWLAYTGGRVQSQSRVAKGFLDILMACVEKVKDPKDFDRLYELMEATLAYHKYYGGED